MLYINIRNAIKLFPEKYEANYRLALAYSYNCSFKSKDCDIGNTLTKRMLNYFPENKNLIALKILFNKNNIYYEQGNKVKD